ncbi:nucleotide excision repair endonuclease [Brevibacillus brevis]|uniref:nucleotide excision repair endonuclease n=1 Tax=Brevibacillus brevis TaxID=1393 RepID=UPI001C8D50D4|nr:nucleotide excision repair endonuclease [Brevibacillus brevis]MBY0088187.1 nucleotide excision repair endonuclease [Brevibacillus brevis]
MINITVPDYQEIIIYRDIKSLRVIPRHRGGIYALFDKHDQLLWGGKSGNLRRRVRSHTTGKNKDTMAWHKEVSQIQIIYVEDAVDRAIYEAYMIGRSNPRPRYNVDLNLE